MQVSPALAGSPNLGLLLWVSLSHLIDQLRKNLESFVEIRL